MKNDIHQSCILVPIPTTLYASLTDQVGKLNLDNKPTTIVTSILKEYLNTAQTNRFCQDSLKPEHDWSNDWIMFGAPPIATNGKKKHPGGKQKATEQ